MSRADPARCWGAIDHRSIERLELVADHVSSVPTPNNNRRCARAASPRVLIVENGFDRPSEPADVTVGDRLPAASARDHLAAAAVVADNHWCTAEQRFKRDEAEDFIARGIDNDGCGGERIEAHVPREQP